MKLAKARLKPALRRLPPSQQPPVPRRSRQSPSPYIFVQISTQHRKPEPSEAAPPPLQTEPSATTMPGFQLRNVRKFWIRKAKTILRKPSATSSLSAELTRKRQLYERTLKIRSESPPCRGKPRRGSSKLSSSAEQLEASSLLLRPAKVFGPVDKC